MSALIDACNEALSQIATGQIASLTENSIEARECARFAPSLVAEMADWTEWRFLRTRVALAMLANDRPAEWLYSYAEPSDMAQPLAIRSAESDATCLPVIGLDRLPVQATYRLDFLCEGGRIYTNVENATLDYSRSTLSVGDMPPLVRRAFVVELAARIALPVKKDARIADAMRKEAELARSRAIADEENKRTQRQMSYVSQAELARLGVGV